MNKAFGVATAFALVACTTGYGQERRVDVQRLPVNGGELEFQVLGEGPPLLLIHGGLIAGMPESFLTQPALSGFKLIAYHRRGYSGSAPETGPIGDYVARHAAEAAALLQHLDVERTHVLGHSSGGTIALQLAFDHPELVESLILLEPAIPALIQDSAEVDDEETSPLATALESGDIVGALEFFMEVFAGTPEWRTFRPGPVIQQTEDDAPTFFAFEMPAIVQWTVGETQDMPREVPVLYVSGTRSPVPEAYLDVVRACFPDAEELVLQNVSHGLHMEDPQSTAEGIASFLRRQ